MANPVANFNATLNLCTPAAHLRVWANMNNAQKGSLLQLWQRWNLLNPNQQNNRWNAMDNRQGTVLYQAKVETQLQAQTSLQRAINYAFNPTPAEQAAALGRWVLANPAIAAPACLTGQQMYQDYITHNQAALTARYGFAIPVNDTSYLHSNIDVIDWAQGPFAQQRSFGPHADHKCQPTTNAMAYVLTQLIRDRKYIQAGEQLVNCISARVNVMVGFNGGNDDHLRVVGVWFTLQDIINKAGIQNIINIRVGNPPGNPAGNQPSVLFITLNNAAGQPKFYTVNLGPPRALDLPNPFDRQGVDFTRNPPYAPSEFTYREVNVQGGKRKTRHAKKSKKSKTRKH